jgi:hypothetical protein
MRTILALALLAAACGGKTSDSNTNNNTTTDTGITDTGPGPLPEGCPPASTEGSCTKEGLLCEYGTDYNPMCNTIRVCSGGRWASPVTFGGAPKCPSGGPPTIPPNPAGCAPMRSSVPTGACTDKITCNYDGAVCFCGVFCQSYPIRMRDCDADAGITTSCCDTTKVEWHCFDGPKYCSATRPRIGTPCTTGDSCAFELAKECGQSKMECRAGVWQVSNNSCPASSAAVKDDIAYVSDGDAEHLREQLLKIPLATYRYKNEKEHHLGFIIEDLPPNSPAVLASRDRVDLYGYLSMAVAAIQRQEKEINALKAEVARLKKR